MKRFLAWLVIAEMVGLSMPGTGWAADPMQTTTTKTTESYAMSLQQAVQPSAAQTTVNQNLAVQATIAVQAAPAPAPAPVQAAPAPAPAPVQAAPAPAPASAVVQVTEEEKSADDEGFGKEVTIYDLYEPWELYDQPRPPELEMQKPTEEEAESNADDEGEKDSPPSSDKENDEGILIFEGGDDVTTDYDPDGDGVSDGSIGMRVEDTDRGEETKMTFYDKDGEVIASATSIDMDGDGTWDMMEIDGGFGSGPPETIYNEESDRFIDPHASRVT